MSLRLRNGITNNQNQENAVGRLLGGKMGPPLRPAPKQRAVLGEISNQVLTQRNSILQKPEIKKSISGKVTSLRNKEQIQIKTENKKDLHVVTRSSKLLSVSAKENKDVEKPKENALLEEKPRERIVHEDSCNVSEVTNHIEAKPSGQCNVTDTQFDGGAVLNDIDKDDFENPQLVAEYVSDIYNYLWSLEGKYAVRENFLKGQDVTPRMRLILVEWLIEVHNQFRLMQETLYTTVSIIDRFLQVDHNITKDKLQLVGVAAMFLSSKYEEMLCPEIADFVYITENTFKAREILHMERRIFKALNFELGKPTHINFLRRNSKAGEANPICHNLSKYFLEMSLLHYELCHCKPSHIAAAASCLAFGLTKKDDLPISDIWTDSLVKYSNCKYEDISMLICSMAAMILQANTSKHHQILKKKYASAKCYKVSCLPELKKSKILEKLALQATQNLKSNALAQSKVPNRK